MAFLQGALIKGQYMFGTFQSIMLLCMNVLCSGMAYITLWYVQVPFIASNVAIVVRARTSI